VIRKIAERCVENRKFHIGTLSTTEKLHYGTLVEGRKKLCAISMVETQRNEE